MTGHQPRLGDLTGETARALELIQRIDARKQAGEAFWLNFAVRIILDLDAIGAGPEWGRLEDKPAETEANA